MWPTKRHGANQRHRRTVPWLHPLSHYITRSLRPTGLATRGGGGAPGFRMLKHPRFATVCNTTPNRRPTFHVLVRKRWWLSRCQLHCSFMWRPTRGALLVRGGAYTGATLTPCCPHSFSKWLGTHVAEKIWRNLLLPRCFVPANHTLCYTQGNTFLRLSVCIPKQSLAEEL